MQILHYVLIRSTRILISTDIKFAAIGQGSVINIFFDVETKTLMENGIDITFGSDIDEWAVFSNM